MSVRYQGLEGSEDVALIFFYFLLTERICRRWYFSLSLSLLYGSKQSLAWPLTIRNHTHRAVPSCSSQAWRGPMLEARSSKGNNIIQLRNLPPYVRISVSLPGGINEPGGPSAPSKFDVLSSRAGLTQCSFLLV